MPLELAKKNIRTKYHGKINKIVPKIYYHKDSTAEVTNVPSI
jgi:hypothetical protein